jgi:hypothetical protein
VHSNPRREFIRHTVDVPIEVRPVAGEAGETAQGVNVSFGGLSFTTELCPEIGQVLELRIPTVRPPFEAHGRVAWCRPEGESYLVGVEFLDASDAFRSRMVQQVCSIESYRREVEEREGRSLSSQQAAAEWVEKYAGRFPDSNPDLSRGTGT